MKKSPRPPRQRRADTSARPAALTGVQLAQMTVAVNWLSLPEHGAMSYRAIAEATGLRSAGYWQGIGQRRHIDARGRKADLRPGVVEWRAITMLYKIRREFGEVVAEKRAALALVMEGYAMMNSGIAKLIK